MNDISVREVESCYILLFPRSYYAHDYRSFASALVAYDWKKAEVTGDIGRTSYAIKLMDSTGSILKSEERDLTTMRAQEE